jgi:glycosyl transferase family 87
VDRTRRLADAGATRDALTRHGALAAGALCLVFLAVAIAAIRAAANVAGAPDFPVAGSPISAPGDWEQALRWGMIGSFLAYAAGIVLLTRWAADVRAVLGLAVAIQLVPLFAPLLLSRDAIDYVIYGRGSDPYHATDTPSVYGPLFTMISTPLARIGDGTYAFRVVAALSAIALALLAWRLAARRKALAAAFVGWNPLVAVHSAGGGHNDALMMALALAGIQLAVLGRSRLAGASWAASILVKFAAAPLYVLWAIQEWRRRRPTGLAALLVVGAIGCALAFAVYGAGWLHVFANLRQQATVRPSLGLLGWLQDLGLAHRPTVVLIGLLQVAAFALFCFEAWHRRLRLGLAAGVLAMLTARLNPWYAIWGISLAAADDDDRWGRVLAVGMTALLLSDSFSRAVNA